MKISKNAFRFCKILITVLVWTSFYLKMKELMLLVFLLLYFSAVLKVHRAPLIWFYSQTFDRLIPSVKVELNVQAMRFAHTLGSIFSGICVLLLYLDFKIMWGFVLIFAILKTISALGYCPGEKIYTCVQSGCCSLTKKRK